MLADRFATYQHGCMTGIVIDPEAELVIFVCRLCGGHSEHIAAGVPVPSSYQGVAHSNRCPIWDYYNVRFGIRRAA